MMGVKDKSANATTHRKRLRFMIRLRAVAHALSRRLQWQSGTMGRKLKARASRVDTCFVNHWRVAVQGSDAQPIPKDPGVRVSESRKFCRIESPSCCPNSSSSVPPFIIDYIPHNRISYEPLIVLRVEFVAAIQSLHVAILSAMVKALWCDKPT